MNEATTYVYTDYLVLLTGVCGCTPEGRGKGGMVPMDIENSILSE